MAFDIASSITRCEMLVPTCSKRCGGASRPSEWDPHQPRCNRFGAAMDASKAVGLRDNSRRLGMCIIGWLEPISVSYGPNIRSRTRAWATRAGARLSDLAQLEFHPCRNGRCTDLAKVDFQGNNLEDVPTCHDALAMLLTIGGNKCLEKKDVD
jgi:hypothetical protein